MDIRSQLHANSRMNQSQTKERNYKDFELFSQYNFVSLSINMNIKYVY